MDDMKIYIVTEDFWNREDFEEINAIQFVEQVLGTFSSVALAKASEPEAKWRKGSPGVDPAGTLWTADTELGWIFINGFTLDKQARRASGFDPKQIEVFGRGSESDDDEENS
jgi:hypothetical protein